MLKQTEHFEDDYDNDNDSDDVEDVSVHGTMDSTRYRRQPAKILVSVLRELLVLGRRTQTDAISDGPALCALSSSLQAHQTLLRTEREVRMNVESVSMDKTVEVS